MIILHGLFGSWENWGSQAKQLAEHFTVYAMDARNHGKSAHSSDMDYPLMAADVLHTMESLGLDKVAMIGHSMGGKTAMQLTQNAPEKITRLVVVDIAPKLYEPGHNEIFHALSNLDLTSLNNRNEADKKISQDIPEAGVRAFVLKNLTRSDNGYIWKMNLNAIKENYPKIIASISHQQPFIGPTIFIKGANSDYILSDDRKNIARFFPNATAKIIDGAGHWPHSEKSAVFYKIVSDFLLQHDTLTE